MAGKPAEHKCSEDRSVTPVQSELGENANG